MFKCSQVWHLRGTPAGQVSRGGVFSLTPPTARLAVFPASGGDDVIWRVGDVVHSPRAGHPWAAQRDVASIVPEARGLSERVLSVLKVVGFVFTENPLQALVLRTLGTTHLQEVCVAAGGCPARGRGPGRAGSMPCAFETPEASMALMHAVGCSAETRGFLNSYVTCLHPPMGSGRECREQIHTNALLLK